MQARASPFERRKHGELNGPVICPHVLGAYCLVCILHELRSGIMCKAIPHVACPFERFPKKWDKKRKEKCSSRKSYFLENNRHQLEAVRYARLVITSQSQMIRHCPSPDVRLMPTLAMPRGQIPQVTATEPSIQRSNTGRGGTGVYELQLRRKLLQQQLDVVDHRCRRVAGVVAKKHQAKLDRQEGNDRNGTRQFDKTPSSRVKGNPERGAVEPSNRYDGDHRGRRRRSVDVGRLPSSQGQEIGTNKESMCDNELDTTKTKSKEGNSSSPPELLTAVPFKKGGCIDHTNKKHILREKQRALERDVEMARRQRPHPKGLTVRDEVPAAPSTFPDRYLRGEVPCSKHCSAGEIAASSTGFANLQHSKETATKGPTRRRK